MEPLLTNLLRVIRNCDSLEELSWLEKKFNRFCALFNKHAALKTTTKDIDEFNQIADALDGYIERRLAELDHSRTTE